VSKQWVKWLVIGGVAAGVCILALGLWLLRPAAVKAMAEEGLSKHLQLDAKIEDLSVTVFPRARITGGGFGGCTVNVVKTESVEKFVEQVKHEYEHAVGIKADCFVSSPSDGALALAAKGGAA